MCSGGGFRSVKNGFEENRAGVIQTLRGLIVAYCAGLRVEYFEVGSGLEEAFSKRQRLELLVGGHHQLIGIAFALTALGVGDYFGEQARSMEVDIGVQVVAAEGIDRHGKALRDVAVAQVLAHDGAVFRFGLGIVVAVP